MLSVPASAVVVSAPSTGSDMWGSTAAAQFCPRCGALLSLQPADGAVACGPCGWSRSLAEMPRLLAPVVTRAAAQPEHAWLLEARAAAGGAEAEVAAAAAAAAADGRGAHARATVNEECPNPACRNPVLRFYTMQLRSADEGQTCFYDCEKCGHKFSVNT